MITYDPERIETGNSLLSDAAICLVAAAQQLGVEPENALEHSLLNSINESLRLVNVAKKHL